MPSKDELEEFFSAAEKNLQQKFAQKYAYMKIPLLSDSLPPFPSHNCSKISRQYCSKVFHQYNIEISKFMLIGCRYNFDIVKEETLQGQFECVRVNQ